MHQRQHRSPGDNCPPTLMMGLPVLVIAMSYMKRCAGRATEGVGHTGATATRGRTDKQHLCMAMVVQRRGGGEEGRGERLEVGKEEMLSAGWLLYTAQG